MRYRWPGTALMCGRDGRFRSTQKATTWSKGAQVDPCPRNGLRWQAASTPAVDRHHAALRPFGSDPLRPGALVVVELLCALPSPLSAPVSPGPPATEGRRTAVVHPFRAEEQPGLVQANESPRTFTD